MFVLQDELVNVGTMDCHGNNRDLCDSLDHYHGTYFYQNGEVKKGEGLVSISLNMFFMPPL